MTVVYFCVIYQQKSYKYHFQFIGIKCVCSILLPLKCKRISPVVKMIRISNGDMQY